MEASGTGPLTVAAPAEQFRNAPRSGGRDSLRGTGSYPLPGSKRNAEEHIGKASSSGAVPSNGTDTRFQPAEIGMDAEPFVSGPVDTETAEPGTDREEAAPKEGMDRRGSSDCDGAEEGGPVVSQAPATSRSVPTANAIKNRNRPPIARGDAEGGKRTGI